VVTRRQLVAAGFSDGAIRTGVRRHRITPLFRGVYLVGPIRGRRHREVAALLTCGGSAVVSHGTAAAMWELGPSTESEAIEVSVRRGCPSSRPGLRVHRPSRLRVDEVTSHHGIALTTPARTILDLSPRMSPNGLERIVAKAERAALCDRVALERIMARHPTQPGSRRLRAILGQTGGPLLTRSEAEARFLALIRRGDLDVPRTNAPLHGFEVDFLWPQQRLVVEIDGEAFHRSRHMFETDRKRDAVLTAAGFRVQRFTWRQLTRESEAVLVRVAQALAWRG
jgi:very-short-patch-repair endonuclease